VAHFYGELQGNRGSTSRVGSKNSGMEAHIRGWNVGVKVELFHRNGRDIIRVYRTNGSSAHSVLYDTSRVVQIREKKK